MIIALASYFEGDISANSVYFSLMCFLIVVGLFLSYGTVYDHLIDREMKTSGLVYMLYHIFLIFAMNNITTALEFMQDDEVDLIPKMLLLIISFILYYTSLFLTLRYSKTKCKPTARFRLTMAGVAISFIALMLIFRHNMYVNIALTVAYVFGIYGLLYKFRKNVG